MPGEMYEGKVWLDADKKRVIVFKTHAHPPCDNDPYEEELADQMRREREEEQGNDESKLEDKFEEAA